MNFGLALALLKAGKRVARDGWNGKGMFIYHIPAGRYPPSTPAGQLIADTQFDGRVPYLPYIAMKTVQGEVVPWLASQTDILAEDWVLAEGETIDLGGTAELVDEAEDELALAGEDGDEIIFIIPIPHLYPWFG